MPALNLDDGIPRLFRSYQSTENQSPNCLIWEAARATCAHPTFFESIKIGNEEFVYGGLCNNPIYQVLEEAKNTFPDIPIDCIVSIGAGSPNTISVPK